MGGGHLTFSATSLANAKCVLSASYAPLHACVPISREDDARNQDLADDDEVIVWALERALRCLVQRRGGKRASTHSVIYYLPSLTSIPGDQAIWLLEVILSCETLALSLTPPL